MAFTLNGSGASHAHSLIESGHYDDTSSWSFSAEDGDKLLGPNGDNWTAYAAMHLGVDASATVNTKAHWGFPFGKDGKVYGSALRAIRSRASAQGYTGIFDSAGTLLDLLKSKEGKSLPVVGVDMTKKLAATRAYSVLNVKSMNDGERLIEGMASTPAVDRMGDIVDPMGAKFQVPMPLLWQHQASQPVGWVEFAQPTKDGIPFKARVASIDTPGPLQTLCDMAWQSVKAGLVKAVSIGFSINDYESMKNGGWNITDWNWLELSLVTIPANAEATINAIKSADAEILAKVGKTSTQKVPAGASARSTTVVSSAEEAKQKMARPIAEQIAAFEATRAAKAARMTEIMDEAAEKGLTLDAAQTEEYDTLADEVKAVDQHLVRLRAHEKANLAKATEVPTSTGADPASGVRAREGFTRVEVRGNNAPKGQAFTRYVVALARAKGNLMHAHEISKQWQDTPEVEMVLRSAVAAGNTTDSAWASPLVYYQNMASEFIELLRPLTIVGRMGGMRRVPFNIKVPRQTGGATVNWVGESSVKPVSALAFDQLSLGHTKIAGIVPLSEELIRFSSPSAEALVTQDLAAAIAQFLDQEFVDPTVSAITGVNPASITNTATPITATGTSSTALREDIKSLLATFMTNSLNNFTSGVWIMTSQQCLAISLMQNALGQPEFPGVTMQGGTFLGFPIIASENVPYVGASPTDGSRIIFALQDQILLADDGQVLVDVSREASLQMDTAPDSPQTSSTVMMSLWQNNLVGIKVERYINWILRHNSAVNYINFAKYQD